MSGARSGGGVGVGSGAVAGLAVLGAGSYGPAGRDALETTLLLRAGLPAVGPAPRSDGTGAPITMGLAPALGDLPATERLVELGARAVRSCLVDLERTVSGASRLGLWLALSPAEVVQAAEAAALGARISRSAGLEAGAPVTAYVEGAIASADLLRLASEALRRGELDVALVCGAHSDHDEARVRALVERGELYTNDRIEGSFAGEQAACVAIGAGSRAKLRAPLARLLGAAAADAPAEATSPEQLAVLSELSDSIAPTGLERRVAWVLSDAAFDPRALREHAAWLTRRASLFGGAYLLDYPAQRIGALGASALPFGLAVIATTWSRGAGPEGAAAVIAESAAGRRSLVLLEPS